MRRVSLRQSPLLQRPRWPGLVSGVNPLPLPQRGILPAALPHLAHRPLPSCTPLPPLPLVVRPRKPSSGQITLLLLRSARPLQAPRLTVAELPSPSLPPPPPPLPPTP